MSRRGWMTSILKTPFFCHRFNTRTILLWRRQIQKRERTTPRKSAEHFQTSSFSSHPVLYGAVAEVLKSPRNVFGESWSKHVLICSKLVSGLSDDGVHHVKTCYFILRLTLWGKTVLFFGVFWPLVEKKQSCVCMRTWSSHLLDELFHYLDHVFIKLRSRKARTMSSKHNSC